MKKKALNVLVVDDDKNFAHTLCDILKSEGYISEEVHSAEAAQKILLSGNFDFVLSDVKMQNQSGSFFTTRSKRTSQSTVHPIDCLYFERDHR
jgi:DNA-binding response OmpR family regulator